jgi:hypothetical protein
MTSKRRVKISSETLADLHRLQDAADRLTQTLGEEFRLLIRLLIAEAYFKGATNELKGGHDDDR